MKEDIMLNFKSLLRHFPRGWIENVFPFTYTSSTCVPSSLRSQTAPCQYRTFLLEFKWSGVEREFLVVSDCPHINSAITHPQPRVSLVPNIEVETKSRGKTCGLTPGSNLREAQNLWCHIYVPSLILSLSHTVSNYFNFCIFIHSQ
jgi:hypothetical protein